MIRRPRNVDDETWFFEHISSNETTGCWNVIGGSPSHANGNYPRLGFKGYYGSVHRWAYQHFVGPLENGKVIAHKCDNAKCANPDHLLQTTTRENVRDMFAKRRHNKKIIWTPKDKVISIIRALQTEKVGYRVADKFGVSRNVVSLIKNGHRHANVLPEIPRPIRHA